MLRVTTALHQYIKKHHRGDTALDLSCGHGHDSFFLSKYYKKVYSFDIQEEAIESARKRYAIPEIHYILDNHQNLDNHIHDKVHCVILNSGYLPHSESVLKTETKSSLLALEKAIELLEHSGILGVCLYRKHEGGLDESIAIETMLSQRLDLKLDLRYTYPDDPLAPLLLVFVKQDIQ